MKRKTFLSGLVLILTLASCLFPISVNQKKVFGFELTNNSRKHNKENEIDQKQVHAQGELILESISKRLLFFNQ
jgi:hypothetical protein